VSAQIGLYFPYFHFPNDEWVKVAALYWDKMYRIVPRRIDTERDTKTVIELSKGETPFIANISPEDFYNDLEEITGEFVKLIENHEDELLRYYGIENRDNWSDDVYTKKYAPDANPKLAYIYGGKLGRQLERYLLKRGFGTTRSDSSPDYDWIGMHPRLANVYMAALAEKIAETTKTNPVTPDNLNYFSVSGFTFERLSQVLLQHAKIAPGKLNEDEIESRLATLAFRAVMPKNIANVPLEKIQKIRESYPREFGKFQSFVQEVVAKIPEVKEVEVESFVKDFLDVEFRKVIQPKLDELDDALNSMGVETIATVLNMEVKVPEILPATGVVGGTALVNPILGATTGIALGLLKIFGDQRKIVSEKIKGSDVAFLLHVRDDLTPAASLDWLNIQARKALFGV